MNSDLIEIERFPEIFLNNQPLIDVRSEIEFAQGGVPNAVNLPILTTSERELVGKCYSKQGQEAAIKLGHTLVNGTIKEQRVSAWVDFIENHPDAALFCWRGGLRSRLAQDWIAEAGLHCPRVHGGFKQLRHYLLGVINAACEGEPFLVISGRTGSGKTRVLAGHKNAIDLEALANHRGSAFGRHGTPQPRTVTFENNLAVAFLERWESPGKTLLEDESRLIGVISLPLNLYEKMTASPVCLITETMANRVDLVLQEYVINAITTLQESQDPSPPLTLETAFTANIDRITKKLGHERAQIVKQEIRVAFHEQGQSNDTSGHRLWIERLLKEYYDPMYDHKLEEKRHRIVFQGDTAAVRQYLSALET